MQVCFYVGNATDTRMTATEVAERRRKTAYVAFWKDCNELLDPLIDNNYRMIEANAIPPAPDELQGQEFGVELKLHRHNVLLVQTVLIGM